MAQIEKLDAVWKIHGDMSIQRILQLRSELLPLPKGAKLKIDFSAVTHVDTSTVSVIFELLRDAITSGCDINFANLPDNLQSLLSLYGVDGLIPEKP